jgi:hypothetical protein
MSWCAKERAQAQGLVCFEFDRFKTSDHSLVALLKIVSVVTSVTWAAGTRMCPHPAMVAATAAATAPACWCCWC